MYNQSCTCEDLTVAWVASNPHAEIRQTGHYCYSSAAGSSSLHHGLVAAACTQQHLPGTHRTCTQNSPVLQKGCNLRLQVAHHTAGCRTKHTWSTRAHHQEDISLLACMQHSTALQYQEYTMCQPPTARWTLERHTRGQKGCGVRECTKW